MPMRMGEFQPRHKQSAGTDQVGRLLRRLKSARGSSHQARLQQQPPEDGFTATEPSSTSTGV